jgi:short-subunit dehydrogenase
MSSFSLSNARICVAGATSTVARATAARLANAGAALHLAARDEAEAERIGRDLQVRYDTTTSWSRIEITDPTSRTALLDTAADAMGGMDAFLTAIGMLGTQTRAEQDPDHLASVVNVNFTAVAQLLEQAADRFEAQSAGLIVALSSVAGDRGRPSNYAYGSAKAGLTAFLDGLRGRLHEHNVDVLTVKPGPVDTKMTFGMDDPPPLMADPERVAADIVTAMEARKDVCYSPSIWRYIMTAIQLIPTSLFKKLDL